MLSIILIAIGIFYAHIILLNVLISVGVPYVTSILLGDLFVSFFGELLTSGITRKKSFREPEFHRSVAIWFIIFVIIDLFFL